MATERSSPPRSPASGAASPGAPRSAAAPGQSPRPPVDRLTVGKLLNHGRAPHEFHPRGHPSYFVKILTDDGERTIWGRGLERALAKSRTQPQVGDAIGIRENNLAPVSFITRTRNAEGLVVATRQTERRGRTGSSRSSRTSICAPPLRGRCATPHSPDARQSTNHKELADAYRLLDTAHQYAS